EHMERGVLDVVDGVEALGLPEAGEHRRDPVERLRQVLEKAEAGALAGGGVEIDERPTGAGPHHRHLADGGRQHLRDKLHHATASVFCRTGWLSGNSLRILGMTSVANSSRVRRERSAGS